jgi:hypothetical protein
MPSVDPIATATFDTSLVPTFSTTVIANAPHPAGVTLPKSGLEDEPIGTLGLLLSVSWAADLAVPMIWV